MSYREMSTWASFLVTLYILGYFVSHLVEAHQQFALTEAVVTGLFATIIIVTIAVEIISQTVIAIINHKEADKGADEREVKFKLIAYRNAYYVLSIGVFIGLFTLWGFNFSSHELVFSELSASFHALIFLLLSFLLAELTYYSTQLFFFRRGY